MVDIDQVRGYMRQQALEDRERHSIPVTGKTLDEALKQASIELGVPVRRIEYEILKKGSSGFFGVGKQNWSLIAYEAAPEKAEDEEIEEDEFSAFQHEKDIIQDADGEVIVKLTSDGVLVKILPPIGNGKKASEKQAITALKARDVTHFDERLVAGVVKQADGQYVRVGDFDYNPVNDSIMTVDIMDAEMKAFMKVKPPGKGGTDLTVDTMIGFLKNNNVIHGIKEDILTGFEEHPQYDQSVLVAEGSKPVNGANARVMYNFQVDRTDLKLKEKNGRVDFREMNLVQNVVEGQALAKKIPAEEGTPGRTVTGRLLPAKNGQDMEIGIGKNVRLSDDGMTAFASINGQVLLTAGKINVEPIYVVEGDVNLKSGGNVIFLGAVVVKGSVEDGFKVKAAGNIEVMGNVGKSEIDAEGDVIVHQGINGKSGGTVKAGKGVWAKFIENSHVEAGEIVVASDGIINSQVDADKKIICQGKRATIVGGHLRAAEEIHAKTLGSVSGSETILEVGYDPKSVARITELNEKIVAFQAELDELALNIATLENLKKVKKSLPEEKEKYYVELLEKRKTAEAKKEDLEKDKDEIESYLASLKTVGKVSASDKVHPGVVVIIKEVPLRVRNDFRATTFILEKDKVKTKKYEKLEEDFSQRQ
ncbi:MAG: FapA family protein [Spirochaetales bacterium]|nr:FapA family protein [Spirochaetales bacterium]